MAMSSQVSRSDFLGNGATPTYSTTFPVKATTELRVFTQDADGQDVELALGADYSAVLGTTGLCTITLTAGNLANGYKLSLQRGIPYTQTVSPGAAYNATAMAVALDRLAMELVRVKGDLDRAIKIPYLEAGGDTVVKIAEPAADRALQSLGFDADGNVMVGAPLASGVTATPFAQTLLDDATAAEARTTLGLGDLAVLDELPAQAARTVLANDTAGAASPIAVDIDDLTVLSSGSSTRRAVGARWAEAINPLDYGVVGDGVTDDTAAIQAILDGLEADGRALVFPARRYEISQITLKGLGLLIDFNNATFIGNASVATTSMVQIKCGLSVLRNLRLALQQNQNYTCGAHWYTNDLNTYFPGRNRIEGLYVTEALIGVVIGALPAQANPIPAQGTVQADGVATNAPLSESYISGLKTPDCIRGLYMRQPNGKVTLVAPDVVAEYLAWSSPPSTAFCCAVTVADDGSELSILGGDVEGIQSPDGQVFQCTGGQLLMEGVCLEGITPAYIAGTGMVRLSHIINWGHNSTTQVMIEVDDGAEGALQILDSRLTMSDAFATGGVSWLKCTSSLAGSFSPAQKFRVEAKGVEFYNAPFTWPTPIVNGCDISFVNCSRSIYTAGVRGALRKLHDGNDLLTAVSDVAFDQISAYPNAASATVAGWTSVIGGGGSTWGKYTTSLPTIESEAPNAACRLTTTGSSTIVVGPAFPIPKGRDIVLRFWAKTGVTGNAVIVRANWFKFDGTTAASTASVDAISGQESAQIGATWRPVILRLQPPADAVKAQVFFYVETGADLQVLNPSVR
jgi:hypothetical protein